MIMSFGKSANAAEQINGTHPVQTCNENTDSGIQCFIFYMNGIEGWADGTTMHGFYIIWWTKICLPSYGNEVRDTNLKIKFRDTLLKNTYSEIISFLLMVNITKITTHIRIYIEILNC